MSGWLLFNLQLALLGSEQEAAVIPLSNLGGMTGMAQSDKCPGLQRSQAIQHDLRVLQELERLMLVIEYF